LVGLVSPVLGDGELIRMKPYLPTDEIK